MLSNKTKPLIICGSGRSLFSDLHSVWQNLSRPRERAHWPRDLHNVFDFMAINDAYLALDHVDHLVSYHDELIWPLLMLRGPREAINGEYVVRVPVQTHSQRQAKGVKKVWAFEDGGGSSSFLGVQIGLELGYSRIVLCGVPFDTSGRFYQPAWTHGHDYAATDGWEIWERWKTGGKLEAVRSLSGRTRDLLGEPERDWLWPSCNASSG